MKLTITDCLAVFSESFIRYGPIIGGDAIDLQSAGSNASLYRIYVPELIKRLQNIAITQPTPLFDACLAPTDAVKFQKWSQVFPRNVVGSMPLIWRINKGDKQFLTPHPTETADGVSPATQDSFPVSDVTTLRPPVLPPMSRW